MPEVKKSVIRFDSANGVDKVVGYFYTCEAVAPKAILQISHGMCEFIGRYDDFAGYMVQNGFVVCGNDHLGHGETSSSASGVDGFFSEKDGRAHVLQDLHRMNTLAVKAYPGLPVILLGHSMGSFFARRYATVYPETICALILSGTGGPNPLGGVGVRLTQLLSKWKGGQYRSKFIHTMAFGAYLKKVDAPRTPYDWISRDTEIVDTYAKNPKCTFMFTVGGFHEMMHTLNAVNTLAWAAAMPKNLPVLLFSGTMDPVGDYGKGVRKVYEMLKDAGVAEVSLKLYEGGRHEMLNETNRGEVYADVLAWCAAHLLPL